ncbi:unnamed protein product, partial [marine sediment metagenome]
MIHRIEIRSREGFGDPHAEGVHHQIKELGIDSVESVRSVKLFFLAGELTAEHAGRIAAELLADPVVEQYCLGGTGFQPALGPTGPVRPVQQEHSLKGCATIEVHLKAGVMDPVAASAEKAVADMGIAIEAVRTARRYELTGQITDQQRETIARRLLANPVIEDIHYQAYTPPAIHGGAYELKIVEVPIRELDD